MTSRISKSSRGHRVRCSARNTEGGAVNIVTKRPSGEFKLNATAGYGNFGAYKGEIHLDLPSFANLSVKLDGIITARDGLTKNPLAGAYDYNSYNKRGFHGEVMWRPVDTFTADYAFDTAYDATTSLYQQPVSAPVGLAATATGPAIAPNKLAAAAIIQTDRVRTAAVGTPEQPSIGRTHGHRLNLEWQAAPELMLKSITSYRAMTQSQYDNGSAAPSLSQPTHDGEPNRKLHRLPVCALQPGAVHTEPVQRGASGNRRIWPRQIRVWGALLRGKGHRQRAGFQHEPVHRCGG